MNQFQTFSILLLFVSPLAFAIPPFFTEKADAIPNICQTCFPQIIKWGGKPHCAPAAVSNSLVWLSKNGFPSLHPFQDQDQNIGQARLVELLGEVMGTSETGGTSPIKVLNGLRIYLENKKVKYRRLASTGWRSVPDFVYVDSSIVNLSWIKEGTFGKNSVWILIGWCKYEPKADNCDIFDGHWMTAVGYGKDRSGHLDPSILVLHDSAERAERKNYYARIEVLSHGRIDGSRSARDVLTLTGDVVLKPTADRGLIQGAYRLEF